MFRALFSLLRFSRQLNKEREQARIVTQCCAHFFYFCTFNLIPRWGVGSEERPQWDFTQELFYGMCIPTAITFFQNHSYINLLDQLLQSNTTKTHKETGLRQTVFTSTAELLLRSGLNRPFVPWSSQYAYSCSCLKINRLFYGTVKYTRWSSHYSEGFC